MKEKTNDGRYTIDKLIAFAKTYDGMAAHKLDNGHMLEYLKTPKVPVNQQFRMHHGIVTGNYVSWLWKMTGEDKKEIQRKMSTYK